MRKVLFTALMLSSVALTINAVPAKRGERTIAQPDGTELTVRLVGDENIHSYITTDGLVVRCDDSGVYRYFTADGISSVAAHNPEARTYVERQYINDNKQALSFESFANRVIEANDNLPMKSRKVMRRSSQVPQTGSPNIPVILVQYTDVKFKDGSSALTTFKNFFEDGSKSARQYFVDQSNGKYIPNIDVYGPYTLSKSRVNYGGNNFWGNDKGVGAMVAEGCQLANPDVDFSKYDNDGDGVCDVMIVLYAGVGEASSSVANSVWPCQWDLYSSDYRKNLTLDGTTISKFAVFNELYADATKIDGIGTFCHEFSHCLDLPDFYDTNSSGKYFGMSEWSLLDYGCYNNNGYTPIGYSAYEKAFMNWIEIPEAVENTHYTLPVMNQKNAVTDVAVRVTNDKDPNEYYILENRKKQGWDQYIPASGMLITHVTYDDYAWSQNAVNNSDIQRMTPIPADNNLKLTGGYSDTNDLKGDLWPYGTATELTNESVPAAKVYTGTYMSKPITEITKSGDNVSFWFMKRQLPHLEIPTIKPCSDVNNDGFTINWEHNTSVDATYTIELKAHREAEVKEMVSTDFTTNPESDGGWTLGTGSAYNKYDSTNKAMRLGSTSYPGNITSPEFVTLDPGQVTVKINCRSYSSDTDVNVKVSILNNQGVDSGSETIVITNQDQDYYVMLEGEAEAATRIKIETTAKRKRALINTVTIYTGDARPATGAQARRVTDEGTYLRRTISGVTGNSHYVDNLQPGYEYDFRIKAVPVDDSKAYESEWSEFSRSPLLPTSGVKVVNADNNDDMPIYYNLQGQRVVNPTDGLYIVRRGTSVTKVLVK